MRIKLRNFRCHSDGDFVLPNKGLSLLSGESGAGKSTILQAIVYALYGNVRKPYTHGKTTCSVELEILGMKIIRTSRPTRLLVSYEDTEYEDESAQGIIDTVLDMNEPEFMASSYIIQNTDSSVLSMTPTEQKRFVQTLAFSDGIHTDYREKIQALMSEKKEGVTIYREKASLLESQYEEARDEVEEVDPVVDGDGVIIASETIEGHIENFEEQLQETQRLIEERRDLLEEARSYEGNRQKFEDKITKLGTEIAQLRQLKSGLPALTSKEDIDELEARFSQLTEIQTRMSRYSEYTEQLHEFESAKNAYFEELKEKLARIEDEMTSPEELLALEESHTVARNAMEKSGEIKEMQKRKKTASDVITRVFKSIKRAGIFSKKITKPKDMIKNLAMKEEEYRKRIDEVSGDRYVCPKCNVTLVLHDTELVESNHVDTDEDEDTKTVILYDSVKRWKAEIEKYVDDYYLKIPSIKGSLSIDEFSELSSKIQKCKTVFQKYETVKRKIEDQSLPVALETWEEKVHKLETQRPDCDYEDVDSEISSIKNDLEKALSAQSAHSAYARDIEVKCRKLASDESDLKSLCSSQVPLSSLEHDISQYTQRLQYLVNEISTCQKTLKRINKYEEYTRRLSQIRKLEKKAIRARWRHNTFEENLKGAMGLYDSSKQAEILAVNNTIESINEHAKIYLERFFPEPISIRLENVKKNKSDDKVKLQMNVSINYKGETYDAIDQLSGGERQRANLAFILGVSDMLGSKILLLDECLNNLGADLNSEVLMYIHDDYLADTERLVLVVSHEAVQGLFDDIILV